MHDKEKSSKKIYNRSFFKKLQKNHWNVNFAGILIKISNSLHILCQSRWLILYIRISYMITNWAAMRLKWCLMPPVFVCLSFDAWHPPISKFIPSDMSQFKKLVLWLYFPTCIFDWDLKLAFLIIVNFLNQFMGQFLARLQATFW